MKARKKNNFFKAAEMKLRRLDRILKNTGSWRAVGEAANKGETDSSA
jgi:hypothetical protein